jgi:HD-like signal output (HDOD) protein
MPPVMSLIDTIHQSLASGQVTLPVYPAIATELQNLARKADCTAQQIERLLVRDQGLASEVLRVANSSFYSGLNKTDTIRAAIMRLGMSEIVNIAVLASQRASYQSANPMIASYLNKVWKHSVACALGSKWLAEKCGYPDLAYEAFMAGLFHDIGELLLLKIIEDAAKSTDAYNSLPESLVLEVIDSMHAEQGNRLLQLWNLPEKYGEIARSHHTTEPDPANALALIVRLADQACIKLGFGLHQSPKMALSACPEASALGVKEVALAELEILLEDALARAG